MGMPAAVASQLATVGAVGADSAVIASGSMVAALALAALAGLVSFASPCVLPLVPGFVGYVTGLQGTTPTRSRAVLGTVLFVAGFTAVSVAWLFAASSAATALRAHQSLLMRLGGVLVIALALVFLGVGDRVGSQSTLQPSWRPAAGLFGAPLLGALFALGWTPCTGPTLGAIGALAVPLSDADVSIGRPLALGLAYGAGLGVPFVLLAAGWSKAERASGFLRRHALGVKRFGGLLLLAIGLLLVSGQWESLTAWLQARFVDAFGTVI